MNGEIKIDLLNMIGEDLFASKLELATALPEDVVSGKTFYAGDKGIKTGTRSSGILKHVSGTIPTNKMPSTAYTSLTIDIEGIQKLDTFILYYLNGFVNSYSQETVSFGIAHFGLDSAPATGYPESTLIIFSSTSSPHYAYYTNSVSPFNFLNGKMKIVNYVSGQIVFNYYDIHKDYIWEAFGV